MSPTDSPNRDEIFLDMYVQKGYNSPVSNLPRPLDKKTTDAFIQG